MWPKVPAAFYRRLLSSPQEAETGITPEILQKMKELADSLPGPEPLIATLAVQMTGLGFGLGAQNKAWWYRLDHVQY